MAVSTEAVDGGASVKVSAAKPNGHLPGQQSSSPKNLLVDPDSLLRALMGTASPLHFTSSSNGGFFATFV
jgi:hypothetical protein